MASLSAYYPQPVVAGITAGTYAEGNDSRITGAVQSGGAAGGGLSGTYPNPTIAPFISTGSNTARSLENRFSERANVVDFGADPTGVADSKAAIQAANDYAASNSSGYVYFPRGQYRTSGTLEWTTPWIGDRGRSVPNGPARGGGTGPATIAYDGSGNEPCIKTSTPSVGETFTQAPFLSIENLNILLNLKNNFNVSNISWAGGIVTVTTTVNHSISSGDNVIISGTSYLGFSVGMRPVLSIPAPNQFTFAMTNQFPSYTGTPLVRHYGPRFTNGIDHLRRVDSGVCLRNVWINYAGQHGVHFHRGVLNCNIKDIRTDACNGFGIYINPLSGGEVISVDGFYCENAGSGTGHQGDPINQSSDGGGAFCIDHVNAIGGSSAQTLIHASIYNGVFEMNTNLSNDKGIVTIKNGLSNPNFVATTLSLQNMVAGGAATEVKSIYVSPASDGIRLSIINSSAFSNIVGIPSRMATPLTTSGRKILELHAPHDPTTGLSPASDMSCAIINTDLAAKQYYLENKKIIPIIEATTSDSSFNTNPIRTNRGMWFFNPSTINFEVRKITEIVTDGVLGSITGVTVSGTSGTNTLTITAGSETEKLKLRRGFGITIGTSPTTETRRIASVDYENGTINLTSNLTNTYTDATVSFPAPLTREHQLMSKRNGQPSTGTFAKGDFLFASAPTIDGHGETVIGYQRLTDGSSNTLGTDWVAVYAPTARNIVATSAPSSAPDFVGQMYVNTSSGIAYVAVGTSASSDWKALATWNP